jgi:hypothetical protein
MKNFLSFLSIVLLLAIAFPGQLTAQTYKQRARSAELLRQILPPELKITADNVRRATQKDIRATISAAGYAADYAVALEDVMIPAKVTDWRGLIFEITSDCNERISYAIINFEEEIYIHTFFSPNTKCEKLYLRMVELGLIYPFRGSTPTEDHTVCLTKNCLSSYSGDCCWNIICGIPKGEECPESTCEAGGCEDCKMTVDVDYHDLFMED